MATTQNGFHLAARIANMHGDPNPGPAPNAYIVIKDTYHHGPGKSGAVLIVAGVLIGFLISEFLLWLSGGGPRMSSTTYTIVAFALLLKAGHILDLMRRTAVINLPRE